MLLVIGTCKNTPVETIKGIDVSHYNGRIDWDKVKKSGMCFGIAKATQGTGFIDPQFNRNWTAIPKSKLVRGAYHFFSYKQDPIEQAKHFLTVVGKFNKDDFPPFIDLEYDELEGEIPDKVTYRNNVEKWLIYVEKKCGNRPIIYTNLSFAKAYLNTPTFGKYKLWLAEYRESVILPEPWKKESWAGWQFTSNGKVLGVKTRVDVSLFLKKICKKTPSL